MTRPVILRREAEDDVESARDWYESQRPGLGQVFLDRVTDALGRIGSMPELFAVAWRDVRFHRMKRSPFVVYYRVWADRVEVLAVLHGSRDASTWQSRA